MSLGFASADELADEPAAVDDDPAPLLLDVGIGFMNSAIWRFTSSNDCEKERRKHKYVLSFYLNGLESRAVFKLT